MRKRTILIPLAILITVGLAAFYMMLLYLVAVVTPPPVNITPSLECRIVDAGTLDYGSSTKVVYLLSQVNGKDIKSVDIDVRLYGDEIPKDIYLLDYSSPASLGCTECEGIDDFKKSFETTLKNYGLIGVDSTLNQIKINQLDKLTHRSILVVPTGKIPAQLVGLESGPDLGELMSRGFVIVFIGSDLTEALYRNGSVVRISNDQLRNYGINYQIKQELYTCGGYRLQNPAFIISNNLVACSMSIVSKGPGHFIVMPRSIDIGWNGNGNIAGEDVGRFLYEIPWQSPLTTGQLKIPGEGINESDSNNSMIFLRPSPYGEGWARITLIATTANNSQLYLILDKKIINLVRGTMLHRPRAVGGDSFIIQFNLAENFQKPKDANISVVVYKDMKFVEKQYAHSIKIQTEYLFSSRFFVDVGRGNYTLRAEDDDGHVYAQSFLNVPPIYASLDTAFWKAEPQVFIFSLSVPKESIPTGGQATDPLSGKPLNLTLNNTPKKDLFPQPFSVVTDADGKFNYTPSQPLPYGWYTFKINVSGELINVDALNPKPSSWFDNPINVVVIVFIIVIGVAGVALRKPEKPVYTIDVPDFPPLEKVIVPISKFSVLSLFDSVNKEYKWSFMPLNAQELKNEMRRKITYKGIPILITDYNLDKVLEELIESGEIVKSLNLYGLKTWETKSSRSIRYLALFRLLRSFLINNAIPFTDLNERKDCDMFATVKGEPLYMHIYTEESSLRRAVELIGAGKNFIIFENKRELEEILKRIDLSYSPLAVVIKSEMGVGGIEFTHPGTFSEMLGR